MDMWQPYGSTGSIQDFNSMSDDRVLEMANECVNDLGRGLSVVIPGTVTHLMDPTFLQIVAQYKNADVQFIKRCFVVLNRTEKEDDYRKVCGMVEGIPWMSVLWLESPRIKPLMEQVGDAMPSVNIPCKGRAVWPAIGIGLQDPNVCAIGFHDADIRKFGVRKIARLALPVLHPGVDCRFSKAYYTRLQDRRLYGRVARILVHPYLRALSTVINNRNDRSDDYLAYMMQFLYPLSGEFVMSADVIRAVPVATDWALEVNTLAEVFRGDSRSKVRQVDLGFYEHDHHEWEFRDPKADDDHPRKGLDRMAYEICISILRTLAGRGVSFGSSEVTTLRDCFAANAAEQIRKYAEVALLNDISYDRADEESKIEPLANIVQDAARDFLTGPLELNTQLRPWTFMEQSLPHIGKGLMDGMNEDYQAIYKRVSVA